MLSAKIVTPNVPSDETYSTMLNYKTKPYDYQVAGSQLLVENHVFGLFDDCGTGKSKTLIDAICHGQLQNTIDAVLLVCPNSIKQNWGSVEYGQIVTHGWENINHTIYIMRSGQKLYPLDYFSSMDEKRLIWVIVNYESVWRTKTETWLRKFMEHYRTAMVLDESQRVKNGSSNQSRGCVRLGQYAKRRYILTGTPVTKNPLDFWAQFRFLDQSITGHRYFNTFRMRYAKLVDQVMGKRTFKTVVGFQNIPELLEKVGPYYRRVEKKDCLELPDKVFEKREVEMNKEQVDAYKRMSDKLVVELQGKRIVAPIALTKILRLLQITGGYITDDGVEYRLGVSPKLKEITNLLEEHDGQSIIFFREHPERHILEEALTLAKVSYACLHGGVKEIHRTEIQQDFQNTSKYTVMLANVTIGGVGLDLTAADMVMYYSNSHSLEHRWQSEDRAMRIGQHRKVTYYDFLATQPNQIQTMDHVVLRTLEKKEDLAAMVVKNVEDLAAFFKGLGQA